MMWFLTVTAIAIASALAAGALLWLISAVIEALTSDDEGGWRGDDR